MVTHAELADTGLAATGGPEGKPHSFGMLVDLFRQGNVTVLSGAGLSTESGIPDYRGPSGQARRTASPGTAQPMTYQAFTGSAEARQRYWARSHLGWRHVTGAAPNAGHQAVAALERAGLARGIVTQNVDGLHQAAGARAVTELHGSLHRVTCLSCWERSSREDLDRRLRAANPAFTAATTGAEPAVEEHSSFCPDPEGDAMIGIHHRRERRCGRPPPAFYAVGIGSAALGGCLICVKQCHATPCK